MSCGGISICLFSPVLTCLYLCICDKSQALNSTLSLCVSLCVLVRYSPSKRWHIDTILHVLTTVNSHCYTTKTVTCLLKIWQKVLHLQINNDIHSVNVLVFVKVLIHFNSVLFSFFCETLGTMFSSFSIQCK